MNRILSALLVIWLAPTAMCLAATNATVVTRQNQEDFGSNLSVRVFQNENTGQRSVFTVSVAPDDAVLTGVRNCFLIISTSMNPRQAELSAPLRLSTYTDGTRSTEFSIASHLIEKAYLEIEYHGDLPPSSSGSKTVYLRLGTYAEIANN